MYLTNAEKEVIVWLNDFIASHKNAPLDMRKHLANYFILEWKTRVSMTRKFMRHPFIRKKSIVLYCIHDILTDWLLAVDQVAERSKEYPIENADKRANREKHERVNVYSLVLEGAKQDEEEYRTPPYSIEERTISTRNPIEDIFFAEDTYKTIEALSDRILHVKKFREFYVTTYSVEMPEKCRSREEVDKAIRKLDITKVKECEICGGAFYAHYRGRIHCDTQKYPQKKLAACEVKAHRKRNSTQKYSII